MLRPNALNAQACTIGKKVGQEAQTFLPGVLVSFMHGPHCGFLEGSCLFGLCFFGLAVLFTMIMMMGKRGSIAYAVPDQKNDINKNFKIGLVL